MKRIIGLPDDVKTAAETVEDAAPPNHFAREIRDSVRRIKAVVDQDYTSGTSGRGDATAP
ncbi:hypothetical protein AAF712_012816 [Marasmius tenuissimus]|uniref:Uncharacterized protein n=1 Tax=Marasmius tenuissimus TaxID=585030 RepID=A0ABR2ZFP1_9AGAR|nr:hypothetical protein PM082_022005 [Marasmius tenuissimus]